ncbi:alpha/beta hydrolase [Serratia sp. NPDC078593]|uniref:alpha/beta hydrolase n=1 Tax=unclassified Serratia (in: enterobacteria) TaxID=2647522 RepID=UPI0037D3A564
MDANSQFDIMVKNNNENDGAQVIYIGVGYQDGVDIKQSRTKDLTIYSADEEFANGGGAEDFYDFIVTCVRPWVESHYPIDVSRQTLAGHSHGGHFVLFTALNHPDAFQNYVAASPSIWWGNGDLIPEGELMLDERINKLTLLIGEYEETLHPLSSNTEKSRVERINAKAKLRTRNLAMRLIANEQRCDFVFLPGRRHPGVIKDYAKIANIIAAQNPLNDGL